MPTLLYIHPPPLKLVHPRWVWVGEKGQGRVSKQEYVEGRSVGGTNCAFGHWCQNVWLLQVAAWGTKRAFGRWCQKVWLSQVGAWATKRAFGRWCQKVWLPQVGCEAPSVLSAAGV
jgi:hypothetical protein